MTFPFQVIIPSRFNSSRLPGKPLLEIGGKTLLQHAWESAAGSRASAVYIATDDERIEDSARSFGAQVIMTSNGHQSGTDRLSEAVNIKNLPDDLVIVNVQGDEFNLPPELIDQVAQLLHEQPEIKVATLCEEISDRSEISDPSVVKVLRDIHGMAIYFSRMVLPWDSRTDDHIARYRYYRHMGLYAYRVGFLKTYAEMPVCELEQVEQLEQLRVLYNGYAIAVAVACKNGGLGVDTEADLARARARCEAG